MLVSANQGLEVLMEALAVRRNNPETIELWTRRISDCKNSGKHTSEWCNENGVNVKTYYYWHNKIHKMVVQQETAFYEVPQQQTEDLGKPAATIRASELQADIYPGADTAMIQAICTALKRC